MAIHWRRARARGAPVGCRVPRRGGWGRPLSPAVADASFERGTRPGQAPPKVCGHSKRGRSKPGARPPRTRFGVGAKRRNPASAKRRKHWATRDPETLWSLCQSRTTTPTARTRICRGRGGTVPPPSVRAATSGLLPRAAPAADSDGMCGLLLARTSSSTPAAHGSAWSAHPLSCKGVTHANERGPERGDAGRSHITNRLRLVRSVHPQDHPRPRGGYPGRQRAGSGHKEASTGPPPSW